MPKRKCPLLWISFSLGQMVNHKLLGRSLINPVIRFCSFGLPLIPGKSSDRLSKSSRRMFSKDTILAIHFPGPIQELSHFHSGLRIGSTPRSGRNIQEDFPQAYCIIQSDRSGIAKTDGPVQIKVFRNRAPRFFGLPWRDRETAIETFYKSR